jgi:hypothetical protein
MAEQLTFHVQVDGDPEEFARRLAEAVSGLPDVVRADAEADEPVRGAIEALQDVTLTVTSVGGLVSATGILVTQVQELLSKFKVRRAEVETSDGHVRQLVGVPTNENPPQQ